MSEIERGNKKSTLIVIIRWFIGILFLIHFLGSILTFNFIDGILYLLASTLAIPPAAIEFEKKFNIKLSSKAKFCIVFSVIVLAVATTPHTTTTTSVNNGITELAAPPSSISSSDTLAVSSKSANEVIQTPTQVTIPEATPTPDNKGTLDIVTSPAGAAVTVDGVSQGLSPINGLSLSTGSHTVDLYLSGYSPHTETVNLANSETKTILWSFIAETSQSPTPAFTPEVTSTPEPTVTQTTTSTNYEELCFASKKSHVYHSAGCRYVEKIKADNLISFSSRKEAEAAGYRPCAVCGG